MLQIDLSGAYMIPSKVYVGDHASLIVPLSGIAPDAKIIPGPSSIDLIIHHAAIERRPGGSFLSVEFSAYTPGILELPPLEIAGEMYGGLKIEISSILAPGESGVLSAPALPLAIPGTSLLIYGSMGAAILLILLTIWVLFWGRKRMKDWLAAWKRRRLLFAMFRTEKRLRKALEKGIAYREILDALSLEFRDFLACLTGDNYRAMTAAEIGLLPAGKYCSMGGEFLGGFFSQCDAIRFNGRTIGEGETQALLGDLNRFLAEVRLS